MPDGPAVESPPSATVVVVAYGIAALDLDCLPEGIPVIVVHNDEDLDPTGGPPGCRHLFPGRNLGFGAGVNLALTQVATERTVVVNPDTTLRAEHWTALLSGAPDEVVTVPQIDRSGRASVVVSRYPTPTLLLLTAFRIGKWAPRGSRTRRVLTVALGRAGTDHRRALAASAGSWPLSTHWASGAMFGVGTDRLRAVDGFDERFFLYLEDVDLCKRLATRFPTMRVRLAATRPAVHTVGGAATERRDRRAAELARARSARTYAAGQAGASWRIVERLVGIRTEWLRRRA